MKVTITAGLLALATKVLAQGADQPAQAVTADIDHDIICETSDASPYLHHVDQVIDELRNEDNHDVCFNQNVGRKTGLKCGKTIREYSGEDGGAAFQFCKTEKVDGPDGVSPFSSSRVSRSSLISLLPVSPLFSMAKLTSHPHSAVAPALAKSPATSATAMAPKPSPSSSRP